MSELSRSPEVELATSPPTFAHERKGGAPCGLVWVGENRVQRSFVGSLRLCRRLRCLRMTAGMGGDETGCRRTCLKMTTAWVGTTLVAEERLDHGHSVDFHGGDVADFAFFHPGGHRAAEAKRGDVYKRQATWVRTEPRARPGNWKRWDETRIFPRPATRSQPWNGK